MNAFFTFSYINTTFFVLFSAWPTPGPTAGKTVFQSAQKPFVMETNKGNTIKK